MTEVMISYHRAGQDSLAEELHEQLNAVGYVAQRDAQDIADGAMWEYTLASWLQHCDAAILLLTEGALSSAWVRYELPVLCNRAKLAELVLLPVYLDGLTTAAVTARPELAPLDVTRWQANPLDGNGTDEHVATQIVDRLRHLLPPDTLPGPMHLVVRPMADMLAKLPPATLFEVWSAMPQAVRPRRFASADSWLESVPSERRPTAVARRLCAVGVADPPGKLAFAKALQAVHDVAPDAAASLVQLHQQAAMSDVEVFAACHSAMAEVRASVRAPTVVLPTSTTQLAEKYLGWARHWSRSQDGAPVFECYRVVNPPLTAQNVVDELVAEWKGRPFAEEAAALTADEEHFVVLIPGFSGQVAERRASLTEKLHPLVVATDAGDVDSLSDLCAELGSPAPPTDARDDTLWSRRRERTTQLSDYYDRKARG